MAVDITKIDNLAPPFTVGDETSVPVAPTFTLTVSGTSVIAAISGTAGATHFLKYKGSSNTAWIAGGSRSGDGTITVTGLSYDVPYIFTVYSQIEDGTYTEPAAAAIVTLAQADVNKFDAQLISEVQIFLNTFGVTVTYQSAGGGSRSIKAIINREGNQALDSVPHGNSPITSMTVANSSTIGISSSELDTGGDKVMIAVRIGQTPQNRRITKIISQDAGMMTLEIR